MKLSRQELAVILLTVALLLVVAGVIFAVDGVYTGGFKHEFRHFYVSAGGIKYLQDADVIMGNVKFDVHYVLKKRQAYTVMVVPTGEDFYYQVDGGWKSYLDLGGVTSAFDVELYSKYFIIRARNVTLQDVLEAMHPGCTVTIPWDNMDNSAHYKLVVSAGDGSQSISLTFRCMAPVHDVEIDPPSLLI